MSDTNKPKMQDTSQKEFLRLFLASEREILRYVHALIPSIVDAHEIVQQTALVLWEKFEEYDSERPFTPWACRFALNVTRQWIDRRQRWKALLDNGLAEHLAMRREQLLPEFEDRLSHLEGCVGKLPGHQRELVKGYYFEQLSVDSLAKRGCRSVEAIYKSLQRVRRQLRACIEIAVRGEVTT